MQETKTRTPAEEMPSSRPPWIRAVAVVAAVALLGGALYATWQAIAGNETPDPDPIGLGNSDPDFSLTDEEAIDTFNRLEDDIRNSLAFRDSTLVIRATTSGSSLADRMRAEIRQLNADQVVDESQVDQQSVEVISSTSEEIRIREVVRIHPCFRSKGGDDITEGDAEIQQTGTWVLQIENGRWLIDEVIFEGDRVINSGKARCES